MDFAEEELDQYREGPQKGIVDIFVHDGEGLLALVFAACRHGDGGAKARAVAER